MRRHKIEISVRAKTMLGAHIKFLAQKSPSAARDTKTKILAAIRSLSEMPERNPFFGGEFVPQNKYHKMIIDSRYLLLYQIKDSKVHVDYILDGKQDYEWLVR
ncbi:MAG: type II toxin-antitoxin system RelE/ParE family toxin [Oscillospiraceae bacterium]|nr:type II toxin-antitoxin system RelE/ParE family toxin [Oscillospiraceae bacterium]MCL2279886.1 type II toxin-antitoxin system RelE/ParE family toxin [Oscillospiraceae bacterium]